MYDYKKFYYILGLTAFTALLSWGVYWVFLVWQPGEAPADTGDSVGTNAGQLPGLGFGFNAGISGTGDSTLPGIGDVPAGSLPVDTDIDEPQVEVSDVANGGGKRCQVPFWHLERMFP